MHSDLGPVVAKRRTFKVVRIVVRAMVRAGTKKPARQGRRALFWCPGDAVSRRAGA
jgi:hypothetical protein